ncbi:uncharacterized protein LOC102808157 [Saccoglossus kowalevskii]|uniref:Uncharacterized protein LOC102808157 n=1 Tax=Saccoglossus kowalevskii TaxID=10224 RepID=A0ABM0LXH3_SACKO|nr:PREDICTED: uncharacterized protein LOC102808157 [Saccoglossus kowalevskii]
MAKLCTEHLENNCDAVGSEFMNNPVNWNKGTGWQYCGFMNTKLDCLKKIYCEGASGGEGIVANINQLARALSYYNEWGICSNDVDETLGPCHLATIREKCVHDTVLRVRSKYSVLCVENVRLLDCIYEAQLNPICSFHDIFDPSNLVPYQKLAAGTCRYEPISQELQNAGDKWRKENPDGYCNCRSEKVNS